MTPHIPLKNPKKPLKSRSAAQKPPGIDLDRQDPGGANPGRWIMRSISPRSQRNCRSENSNGAIALGRWILDLDG